MVSKTIQRLIISGSVFLVMGNLPMVGQETRSGAISQKQAAKTLAPEEPSRAEQFIFKLQEKGLLLSANPRGLFPYFDSVYPGGGLTLGGGYRHYYGDYTFAEIRGLYSFKSYKLIEARTVSSNYAGGRVALDANLLWRDATQVPFYGLGPSTAQTDQTTFGLSETNYGGGLTVKPVRWFHLRSGVSYHGFREKAGAGDYPSIEEEFDRATAPGLGAEPSYVDTQISAAVLWSGAEEGYSRKGGLYRYTFHDYRNLRGDLDNFQMSRGEVVQHIPFLRETWVLSLRGRVESVMGDTVEVPYFLLPYLGSGSTLRGYGTGRYRDRSSLLLTGEWRWIPNRMGLDMALFYDCGKVAPSFSDLSFTHLKSDVGVGVRFHGPSITALRIDLAHGSEGWKLVFSASAPF